MKAIDAVGLFQHIREFMYVAHPIPDLVFTSGQGKDGLRVVNLEFYLSSGHIIFC